MHETNEQVLFISIFLCMCVCEQKELGPSLCSTLLHFFVALHFRISLSSALAGKHLEKWANVIFSEQSIHLKLLNCQFLFQLETHLRWCQSISSDIYTRLPYFIVYHSNEITKLKLNQQKISIFMSSFWRHFMLTLNASHCYKIQPVFFFVLVWEIESTKFIEF